MTHSLSVRTFILAMLLFIIAPVVASANNQCSFGRTLDLGVTGEDVRCLQIFLNDAGFTVADSGPGSAGNETTRFGELTTAAVLKWQTAIKVPGANGVFGPASQGAYLLAVVSKLETQQVALTTTAPVTTPAPQVAGVSTSDPDAKARTAATKMLEDVVKILADTQSQIEDADEDEILSLYEDLADVQNDFYKALLTFFDGDYTEAQDLADEVLADATDVLEDAGGESEATEAEDLLDDVLDLYDEVEELIGDAEDDDAEVGDAPDLLDEAADLLDDAQDAFDARVYRQAVSDALDAEELLEEAKGEIDVVTERDANKAVDDAIDAYDDAQDEINDADDDGEDVDDAEDYLSDAKKEIKRAEAALDDEDWVDAADYAAAAEKLIKKALKAL